MTIIPILTALIAVLALGVVLLGVRTRSLQNSLAGMRELLRRASEEARHAREVEALRQENTNFFVAEREALRQQVADLEGRAREASAGLSTSRVEIGQLWSELQEKAIEAQRVEQSSTGALKDAQEWISATFSPYLNEVVPENAGIVEDYAAKLNQWGLEAVASDWYWKLAEACLRFGDLDRADRASSTLKTLRPGDKKVAELRSRVLLRLGRIMEAREEMPRPFQ